MKTINKIIIAVLVVLTYSCEDILEENITNDTVQILSPIDNLTIESNVVSFKWSTLSGADQYRIQVYQSDQVLILDSLTNKTNITLPLNAGNYVWRVRGENFAYESIYSFPSNFSTSIPDDLTNQQVVLINPDNDKFFNFINVTLNWQALGKATSYSIKIVNTLTSQEMFSKTDLTATSWTLDLPNLADGNYQWKIKAKNASSETKQYAVRKFSIDTTVPNQPKNTFPADNATQSAGSSVSYNWSIPTDAGSTKSPISYIIEFATDIDFDTILQTQNSNTTTLLQTSTTAGVYYWRVRAIDKAGNIGPNSTGSKFTVN